tara:strand:- start:3842 stop:4201 length:360 start_codon:yes stop_codon:yes gene_type:complete
MKFTLTPYNSDAAQLVALAAPIDYPFTDQVSCRFLVGRDDDGAMACAAAVRMQYGSAEIVGLNFIECADDLEAGFVALVDALKSEGVTRLEFAAETNAVAGFAERMGMSARAVFYVKAI